MFTSCLVVVRRDVVCIGVLWRVAARSLRSDDSLLEEQRVVGLRSFQVQIAPRAVQGQSIVVEGSVREDGLEAAKGAGPGRRFVPSQKDPKCCYVYKDQRCCYV